MSDTRTLLIQDSSGTAHEINPSTILSIDTEKTLDQLCSHPDDYERLTWFAAEIQRSYQTTKEALRRHEADLYREWKLEDTSGKKLTEAGVDAIITNNETTIELRDQLIELDYLANRLKGIVLAMQDRHDALIQLSAHQRNWSQGE